MTENENWAKKYFASPLDDWFDDKDISPKGFEGCKNLKELFDKLVELDYTFSFPERRIY